jgi:hypothetical protein
MLKLIGYSFLVFKNMLKEYTSLVAKRCMDAPMNKPPWENLDFLCDFKLVLALPCILPMLEVVHTLIIFAKKRCIYL